MPKIDSQGRITIPSDLRQSIGLNLFDEIALCYDFSNGTITLCKKHDIADNCVISFRNLDSKGRFIFPKEYFDLLGITKDEPIVIFLQNNKLCIKGMGGAGT